MWSPAVVKESGTSRGNSAVTGSHLTVRARTTNKTSQYDMVTPCWPNVGLRLRRWPNIRPTRGQRLVCALYTAVVL